MQLENCHLNRFFWPQLNSECIADIGLGAGRSEGRTDRSEERFLTAQADTFAGANVKEKESARSVRNDGVGRAGQL